MPKNKTRPTGLLYGPLDARESRQVRLHTHTYLMTPPVCVCAPQAILRALKSLPPFRCCDMPWTCPLGDNKPREGPLAS